MLPPKISIVIPVYNVELYLRQCLDSVVNQTLREIQIICVNDGSTDSSLAILHEYAARDGRIEVIDKPNGGQSSARNAAYPSIKGKYTQFIDSDDWIDLDTCEKLFNYCEYTGADWVSFYYDWYHEKGNKFQPVVHLEYKSLSFHTHQDKKLIAKISFGSPWDKLFRTDFIRQNNIVFQEGLVLEDQAFYWDCLQKAEKIAVLPMVLYHYRQREGSTAHLRGRKQLDFIEIIKRIKLSLKKNDLYELYKAEFIEYKLLALMGLRNKYVEVSESELHKELLSSLDADDMEFLQNAEHLPRAAREFYLALLGDSKAKRRMQSRWRRFNNTFLRPVIQPVESVIRFIFGKEKKRPPVQTPPQERQIQQLSELVSQLCEEVVRLREQEHEA